MRDYWVYVPAQYTGKKPACVHVNQDGVQFQAPVVFDNLVYGHREAVKWGPLVEGDLFGGGRGRFRVTERVQEAMGCRPYSNFNLVGAAQVGKSSLTGMRLLHRLQGRLPVWPVDPLPESGSVICEIYTTIAARAAGRRTGASKVRDHADLNRALAELDSAPVAGSGAITDHAADALITAAWLRNAAHDPALWAPPGLTPQIARTEGWTFGAT